jgi:hypothetical protein
MSSNIKTTLRSEPGTTDDPFRPLGVEKDVGDLKSLLHKLASHNQPPAALPTAVTAQFCGFNLDDGPLVSGLPGLPGEIVLARTTILLLREQIGSQVLVLFDGGHVRRPIVIGVLQQARASFKRATAPFVALQADDQRLVLTAEREIELRCGEASITLSRAGKVLIRGKYILSRSSGYNRIKGAAVDIN